MKTTFSLKELTEDIDESIVDLFHNFPKSEFGISYPEVEMNAEMLKNHIKNEKKQCKNIKKFVFYYENVPVGFATIISNEISSLLDCKVSNIDFCIRESYRGFGLGNLILNKLITKSFDLGLSALKCVIQNDNEKAKKVLNINNFKKINEKLDDDNECYYLKLKI